MSPATPLRASLPSRLLLPAAPTTNPPRTMMKLLMAVACVLACVAAAPQRGAAPLGAQPTPIPILRSIADTNHDGNYVYSYETGNSIAAQEESKVLDAGTPNERRRVEGSYRYVDNEGNPFEVVYFVEPETGFVAQGAHLPREPEYPEWLQRALARNAEEEARLSPQQLAEVETGRYIIH